MYSVGGVDGRLFGQAFIQPDGSAPFARPPCQYALQTQGRRRDDVFGIVEESNQGFHNTRQRVMREMTGVFWVAAYNTTSL